MSTKLDVWNKEPFSERRFSFLITFLARSVCRLTKLGLAFVRLSRSAFLAAEQINPDCGVGG
jgi:hypothetical protein